MVMKMMNKLLLHVCCAHCAAYPVEYWQRQGSDVTAFFYNPNIHPFLEHQNRLEAVSKLALNKGFPLVIAPGYAMEEYFRRVVGHESTRCRYCFELRLSQTAVLAKQIGINKFTTTLLISHHQNHELLKEMGDKIANEHGLEFLYVDLRKRFSDSRVITKPQHLYVQQYCGCVYSKWESYGDNLKKQGSDRNTTIS